MLNQLIKLIKVLNANENPAQLAGAIVVAMVMALTPFWSLHNLVLVFLLCVLRLNLFLFFLAFALWSGIAWGLDPYSASLGESLLMSDSLNGLWTTLYQSDFWRLAHFNNTLTLGSFVLSLILLLPVYFLSLWLVTRYRDTILAWINRTHAMQALKASKWYQRFASLYDVSEAVQ